MRAIRMCLVVLTLLAFALSAAALIYAQTTDTSRTTSNANLGETWAHIWFVFGCGGVVATGLAALLDRADRAD